MKPYNRKPHRPYYLDPYLWIMGGIVAAIFILIGLFQEYF